MIKYSKIDLMQIEKNDIPDLKRFINSFRHHLPEYKEVNIESLNEQYLLQLTDPNAYYFTIRGLKEGGYALYTEGFCSINNIDWVARHGELRFLMQGSSATFPSTESAKQAFGKLLSFGFEEINLNKLWINVVDGNNIKEFLDKFGFVAEGIKREACFKRGEFVDITVCSLLAQEYGK